MINVDNDTSSTGHGVTSRQVDSGQPKESMNAQDSTKWNFATKTRAHTETQGLKGKHAIKVVPTIVSLHQDSDETTFGPRSQI